MDSEPKLKYWVAPSKAKIFSGMILLYSHSSSVEVEKVNLLFLWAVASNEYKPVEQVGGSPMSNLANCNLMNSGESLKGK